MKPSLTLILFTCLATIAAAQCRNGTGAPVGTPSAYTWRKNAERPDESYLYKGNRQISGYDHARAIYLPILCPCGDACQCRVCNCKSTWGAWGAEREPPVAPRRRAGPGGRNRFFAENGS